MKKARLDEEERDVRDSFERGEWEPVKNERAVREIREQVVGDRRVVVDEIALGEPVVGPKHLVDIRRIG